MVLNYPQIYSSIELYILNILIVSGYILANYIKDKLIFSLSTSINNPNEIHDHIKL